MSLTASNMLDLGIKAPEFSLPNVVTNQLETFENIKGEKGTMVMFICNHCPFVVHIFDQLLAVAKDYQSQGIGFVAISSNDVNNYPQDRPEKMAELSADLGFSFPYLYDESQSVAKEYDAACTPDFYLFDKDDILVYRGRLDDSRPGNGIPLTGTDLRNAMDAVIKNEAVSSEQFASMGCNIKWK